VSCPFDSPPLPDWALEHARASLKLGQSVPEIEQRLVGRGLSPAAAAAVVEKVLEERVRERLEPLQRDEQRIRLHRILSAVVGCACLVFAYLFGGGWSAGKTATSILLPLAFVWFGDEMASYWSRFSSVGWTPGI
jgi:hypothetical protein